MTRAVIELAHDISGLVPKLADAINSYGYDYHGPSVGFRFEDVPVIIERNRVTIYGAFDEETANRVMEWLDNKNAQLQAMNASRSILK
jgi:hypothetical protein